MSSTSETPAGAVPAAQQGAAPALPTIRIVDFKFAALTNTTYVRWARRMRDHLVMCGLGEVLQGPVYAQSQVNLLALTMIRSNVDDNQLTAVEEFICAHKVWCALHDAHAASCTARRMHIRGQLASLRLAEGESIREYGSRAVDLRRALLDVGASCGEEELVDYVLLGLPPAYHTIRAIVGDSSESSLENVVARLSRYQEQELHVPADAPGAALYGSARQRARRSGEQRKIARRKRDDSRIICFNCKERGHRAADCKKRPARYRGARSPSPEPHGRSLVATALAARDTRSSESWVIDTGATHHMTGDASGLVAMRKSPIKSIVFGGGQEVAVLGQGDRPVTSVVRGKRHNITLRGVLLLDKMIFNLLSVPTMATKGFRVSVVGDSCVVEDDGEEIVVAPKIDGLYQACLPSDPGK